MAQDALRSYCELGVSRRDHRGAEDHSILGKAFAEPYHARTRMSRFGARVCTATEPSDAYLDEPAYDPRDERLRT